MINKEEMGRDKIDESTMLKQIKNKLENENIPIETLLAEFNRLEDIEWKLDLAKERIKELEEINEEHQKLNGELQEKYTKLENHYNCRLKDIEMLNAHIEKLNARIKELEETLKGKSIQEMGMSDLYKED